MGSYIIKESISRKKLTNCVKVNLKNKTRHSLSAISINFHTYIILSSWYPKEVRGVICTLCVHISLCEFVESSLFPVLSLTEFQLLPLSFRIGPSSLSKFSSVYLFYLSPCVLLPTFVKFICLPAFFLTNQTTTPSLLTVLSLAQLLIVC